MFVLITDGIIEAEDQKGEFFGERNLIESLLSCTQTTASETTERVLDSLNAFTGKDSKLDDIALIAVRREQIT